MDHHTVAAISIAGSCLDVVGSLYLAYDLLGGQHGPLRLITRIVTYSIILRRRIRHRSWCLLRPCGGYCNRNYHRDRAESSSPRAGSLLSAMGRVFSAIRGVGFGVGLYRIVGLEFASAFAILITVGQVFGYSRGISPSMDYAASRRPRLTRRQFWGTVVRTFGYFATALICSALVHHVNWSFAIRVGW
jgi:hypothetical protein